MATDKYITTYENTEANVKANLDAKCRAILSDGNRELVWRSTGGTRINYSAVQKYWDGATDIYVNNDFGQLTLHDDLIVDEYIRRVDESNNDSIRLAENSLTLQAGSSGAFHIEDDRVYTSVSMYVGSNISSAGLNIDNGISIDLRSAKYTDSLSISASSSTTKTFQFPGNSVSCILELATIGNNSSLYSRKIAQAFSLSSDILEQAAEIELYDTGSDLVSYSFDAVGSNNRFTIQIHNNDSVDYLGACEYNFLINQSGCVARV